MYAVKVKVLVSQKWCKIDTFLMHATDSKCHMACRFVPFPVTLNDLDGHSSVAMLFKCSLTNICSTFHMVSTDLARCTVPLRQLLLL